MSRWRKLFRSSNAESLPSADVTQFEPLARRRLSKMAYDYVRSGGGDEISMRENRAGFERLQLEPSVLVDVSEIDTRVNLFGSVLESPILLAPVAYHRLYHVEGEIGTARGANAAGAGFVISTFTTTSIDEIARNTQQPIWFQLYVQRDREFTKDMVQRAVASGCKAVCLTVDTPVLCNRYGQLSFGLPKGMECVHLRGLDLTTAVFRQAPQAAQVQSAQVQAAQVQPTEVQATQGHKTQRGSIYDALFDPSFNWNDLEWLRSVAGVPVILKGVLSAEDGRLAVSCGADGVIVSNHGGRNLDTVPATIDALPRVVDAVAGRIPVMLDSGIRRGTDVLMALALGAKAVFIGRPYVYGLAVGGARGVERVISILRDELERAMALTGRRSIAEIDATVLRRATDSGTGKALRSPAAGV
ncbi:MAG TPA: alpha-hydroxy acid oxidase [Candidatus Angelobacter sp.]|nr:alpha-hydroxy acid oxidase [Candidatus Angelobacter sp.]